MIYPILHYPDKRLRIPGKPITEFNEELKKLIDDMAETMYAAPGVGLAATQIGVLKQLFIVDVAPEGEPSDLKVFINPEILEKDGEIIFEEGCLSFPGIREEIKRAEAVKVKALDAEGKPFELEADGLLAVAIQHEKDHLEGKLMVDHVSMLKKRIIHKTLVKKAASHH